MLRLLLILFALCCFNAAYSQGDSRYLVQQFTTENGLPSNGIKGLEWDEQTGFLWIATEAGIARYNGVDFRLFTKQNTPGLYHERVSYSVKNSKGEIFSTDVGENTVRVNANAVSGIKIAAIDSFFGYKKNLLLTATGSPLQKRIISLLNENPDIDVRFTIQMKDTATIVYFGNTYYYISTKQQEPRRLTIPSHFQKPFLLNSELFFSDKKGDFYIARNNFSSFLPIPLTDDAGRQIDFDKNKWLLRWENGMNNPILFSKEFAWVLHYKNGKLYAKLISNAVPKNSFIGYAQYSEKHKTLFIGTDSKGLIVISENKVMPMKNSADDFGIRNAVYSQLEISDNVVLANTGQVIGSTTSSSDLPIKGSFDFTIYNSGDSVLWYTQADANLHKNFLRRFNYRTGKTIVYSKIEPVNSSFAMAGMNGQFYFSFYKGLGRLQGDTLEYLFRPGKNKAEQAASYSMLEFSPGVLGVASCDGLILYDVNKRTVDTLLNPFGYCIRSLWKYKDYIFIGSYGKGFYIWKNGKLKAMPLDKNNYLLYTHCFIPDNNGFCWISSNRGLFKVQLSDLIHSFENDGTEVYYHYLGKKDGMEITELNGGCYPCALQLKSGLLSFPTMDGLLWVNPDKANVQLPEGNIYIDQFRVGNKNIAIDSISVSSFPASTHSVSVSLGFSDWCNKENIYLDYRLNNSKEWLPVDMNNGATISLTGLVPGKYQLEIRKLNGFGANNYSFKTIHFSIKTPWTSRWWFFALCGLALFGLISLYLKWRTKQYQVQQKKLETQVAEKTRALQQQNEVLEKNNSIKTRLISIISHDIITPLKFVTVAGKNLLEKKNLMSEELQQETVQEMTNTSQELQLLSTNILNWIKYQNENRRMVKENFNLKELVDQLFGILQSLAKQKGLSLINTIHNGVSVYQYYEPLKILIYNLLTNAIHFTEKGNITVAAERNEKQTIVSVNDEGVGMTPEQIDRLMEDNVVITSANVDNKKGHGLGYLIIKDLLKTMHADLKIESIKGEGATVIISMEN